MVTEISNGLKILGIIGIRSGSKSLLHKNIRPLAGKPLVGWIIEAAKKSRYINRLIVSTDSEEYAAVAKSFGAEVPCLRPKEFALDHSLDYEYIRHMLEWLEKNEGYRPDVVLRLMATVPLQLPEDIDGVIEELIKDPKAHSAVVIAEARQHPLKALKLVDDGRGELGVVSYFDGSRGGVEPTARQDYEKAYFRANIIASRKDTIFSTNTLTGTLVRYHIIPQERAVDIDGAIDFYIVEKLMEKYKNDGHRV